MYIRIKVHRVLMMERYTLIGLIRSAKIKEHDMSDNLTSTCLRL